MTQTAPMPPHQVAGLGTFTIHPHEAPVAGLLLIPGTDSTQTLWEQINQVAEPRFLITFVPDSDASRHPWPSDWTCIARFDQRGFVNAQNLDGSNLPMWGFAMAPYLPYFLTRLARRFRTDQVYAMLNGCEVTIVGGDGGRPFPHTDRGIQKRLVAQFLKWINRSYRQRFEKDLHLATDLARQIGMLPQVDSRIFYRMMGTLPYEQSAEQIGIVYPTLVHRRLHTIAHRHGITHPEQLDGDSAHGVVNCLKCYW